jgi:iron complex outermembrane recepter protein
MKNRLKLLTMTIGVLSGSIVIQPAMAQDDNSGPQGRVSKGLEEIIVTAQRRAENIQEVPIAISAFDEEFLSNSGVTNTEELNFVTPGLNFTRQIAAAVIFMRGVGTDRTSAGIDPSVSTYVDGVYSAQAGSNIIALNNVERIEVLKGPQGTLFGRNASGGLIHIITKDPSHESSGQLQLSYGNYNTAGVNFYGTTGLSDNVAADLAISFQNQGEGYGTNLATGNDVNETETLTIRNKWKIDISDATQVTFAAEYTDTESSAGVSQRLAPGNLGIDGLLGLPPTVHVGDFQDINASIDPVAEIDVWGVSAKVEHSFDDIDLVSITAYRDSSVVQTFASDSTPFPGLIDAVLDANNEMFTQEIRLSGGGDNFRWIVGGFYLNEDSFMDDQSQIRGLFINTDLDSNIATTSWALFAQADFDITDKTTFTAGIRYTEDERELTGTTTDVTGGLPPLSYQDDTTFDELTWRLSLQHQFTKDFMGYISYNRGFKSGIYNILVTSPAGSPDPVLDPEIIDAFEIGIKSELFDNRVRLNAAAFLYDFQDLQVTIPQTAGTGQATFNAPSAEIKGAEIEVNAALTDAFSVHAGVSYLDTEVEEYPQGPLLVPTGIGANVQVFADLTGNHLQRAPELTFSIGGEYVVITDSGEVIAGFNYYYNDGFFWDIGNTGLEDDYSVTNVHLTWFSTDEKYSVRLYGNNVFDEEYAAMGNWSTTGNFLSAAPPRTYGLKAGYYF